MARCDCQWHGSSLVYNPAAGDGTGCNVNMKYYCFINIAMNGSLSYLTSGDNDYFRVLDSHHPPDAQHNPPLRCLARQGQALHQTASRGITPVM